jgi:YD repeat-containing protein
VNRTHILFRSEPISEAAPCLFKCVQMTVTSTDLVLRVQPLSTHRINYRLHLANSPRWSTVKFSYANSLSSSYKLFYMYQGRSSWFKTSAYTQPVSDGQGRLTSYSYDLAARTITVRDEKNGSTAYASFSFPTRRAGIDTWSL